MIKKLVTVAAASTFLMAAPLAFAQDATNPPADTSGTAPAASGTTGSDTTGGAGASGTTTGTDTTGGASTSGSDTSGTTGTSGTTTDTSGTTTGTAGSASTTTTDGGEVAGTYLTEQSTDQISADDYIGTTVYNSNNESIGEINDLILQKDGGIVAAVIGVGGFLGIGEKNVAVPMSNIMVSQNETGSDLKLTTSETADTLKNAPEFKTLDEQNMNAATPSTTDPATGTTPADPATGTTPAAPASGTTAPANGDTTAQ